MSAVASGSNSKQKSINAFFIVKWWCYKFKYLWERLKYFNYIILLWKQ